MRHWSVVILLAGTGKVDRSFSHSHISDLHMVLFYSLCSARLILNFRIVFLLCCLMNLFSGENWSKWE